MCPAALAVMGRAMPLAPAIGSPQCCLGPERVGVSFPMLTSPMLIRKSHRWCSGRRGVRVGLANSVGRADVRRCPPAVAGLWVTTQGHECLPGVPAAPADPHRRGAARRGGRRWAAGAAEIGGRCAVPVRPSTAHAITSTPTTPTRSVAPRWRRRGAGRSRRLARHNPEPSSRAASRVSDADTGGRDSRQPRRGTRC